LSPHRAAQAACRVLRERCVREFLRPAPPALPQPSRSSARLQARAQHMRVGQQAISQAPARSSSPPPSQASTRNRQLSTQDRHLSSTSPRRRTPPSALSPSASTPPAFPRAGAMLRPLRALIIGSPVRAACSSITASTSV
jgi:hypothetical protein